MNGAEFLIPGLRWDLRRGFDPERTLIDRALELGVGGFILFGGSVAEAAALITELRSRSRVPLLIGADLERGAGQQFAGATGLPPLAAIGSLDDDGAVRRAAALTAREARAIGVDWGYAPVCDLDLLPENPIIGTRAFGAQPSRVAALASAWIQSCQDERVLACAKHFPGHGRTTGDSHMTLPVVDAPSTVLRESDLVPFRAAVEAGVASIMTAHVAFPALDPSGKPATLSQRILHGILRGEIRFDGLIVSDALIMEGALVGQGEAEAAIRALEAGCDLLLYPSELDVVARAIADAVEEGRLDQEQLRMSMARRERWAQWAHSGGALARPLATPDADRQWAAELADAVVHVARGGRVSIASPVEIIIIDDDVGGPYPPPSREPFLDTMRAAGANAREVESAGGDSRLPVLIALFGDIRSWKDRPGYSAASREAVSRACAVARARRREPIVVQFGHPRLVDEIPGASTVVCAWGGERPMQEAAARRILAGM